MFRSMPDFNREIAFSQACGPVYLFTNENISGSFDRFDMRGKRVLSVASGGDHVFECLLAGASLVDTFDINYAQKVIVELKSRMIKSLPYEDFMDFFFDKKHFFDKNILKPIWNDFSHELSLYMDWYYCMGDCAPRRMFMYGKSMCQGYDKNKISYLSSPEKYNTLALNMITNTPQNINFVHTNLRKLAGLYNQKYDFILLSNIFDYWRQPILSGAGNFTQFYNYILKPLSEQNLISNDGHIMLHYVWNPDDGITLDWYVFSKEFNTKKKDVGQKMSLISVPSPIIGAGKENLVMHMTQNLKTK